MSHETWEKEEIVENTIFEIEQEQEQEINVP